MDEIKRDIKAVTSAIYPEAIKQAETPQHWKTESIGDRHRKIVEIETRITALRPDALEFADLLDCLAGSLKLRYDDCTEALLYATLFKLALERLDNGYQTEGREALEALEAQVHRSERLMP